MRVVDSIKFVSPDGSGVVTALETFTSAPATDDVMRPVPTVARDRFARVPRWDRRDNR
jgi:hypothetical protein